MKNYNEMSAAEKWENATLANNFIFYKVMRNNPEVCKHMVEMLLGIEIGKIEMATEDTIMLDHEARGIRLDVYLKDSSRVIDVEMQIKDSGNLPERARYYQSALDVDNLTAGTSYEKLKDSHIIFICLENPFEKEHPIYTFENTCQEDSSVKLNDRTWKHFFIAPLCAKMLEDKELRALFSLIMNNSVGSTFTDELKNLIANAKKNTKWRHQYMIWENNLADERRMAREEGLAEGLQLGRTESKLETAVIAVTKYKVSPEEVAADYGIELSSLQEALKNRESLKTKN